MIVFECWPKKSELVAYVSEESVTIPSARDMTKCPKKSREYAK